MRQQKSKIIYYLIGFALLAGLFYIAAHEIPFKTEHVQQPVANDFLEK